MNATAYRYLIFSNSDTHEGRTRMVEAWPGIRNFRAGDVWTLVSKSRAHHDDVWGPPESHIFDGGLELLRARLQALGFTHEAGAE